MTLFEDVNLDFEDSGLYLVLGESGCGKTTLLNIIYDIVGESAEYITQTPVFVDYLTVRENLSLISDDYEMWLERFGVEATLDKLPSQLSGGERQRVAVLRALMRRKRILLLDEPTSALDKNNKKKVFELLRELAADALIICATHDRDAIEYADCIVNLVRVEKCTVVDTQLINRVGKSQGGDWQTTPGPDSKTKKIRCLKYLKKWFSTGVHRQKQKRMFCFFIILTFLLLFASDTYEHHSANVAEYLYGINIVTLITTDIDLEGLEQLSAAGIEDAYVKNISMSYMGSWPIPQPELIDGIYSVDPMENVDTPVTLTFDKKYCHISDNVEYGSYFTEANQVMLTKEMADRLSVGNPGALVGTTMEVDFYNMGVVDMEIVGIFGSFDRGDRVWLNQITSDVMFEKMFFINDRFTSELEKNSAYYSLSGTRMYYLYFDHYVDAVRFCEKYGNGLEGKQQYRYLKPNYIASQYYSAVSIVLLPMAVVLLILSVMFYAQMQRMEYIYGHGFLTAFEYLGFDRKWLMRQFRLANLLQMIKNMFVGISVACLLSAGFNFLNSIFRFTWLLVFSYNVALFGGLVLLYMFITWAISCIVYRKLMIVSWYEDQLRDRDLM